MLTTAHIRTTRWKERGNINQFYNRNYTRTICVCVSLYDVLLVHLVLKILHFIITKNETEDFIVLCNFLIQCLMNVFPCLIFKFDYRKKRNARLYILTLCVFMNEFVRLLFKLVFS
jgi:hypothetical protein